MPDFVCHVQDAGVSSTDSGTSVGITLTDTAGGFEHLQMGAPAQAAREMLAVSLTAMSTGRRVWVTLPNTTEYGTIEAIFLV